MTRNWIAVSLMLAVATALLAWRLHLSVNRFRADNDLARIQPVEDLKRRMAPEGGLAPMQPLQRPNPADFAAIPAQNLFAETRAKEEIVDAPVVERIPDLTVKPILVGVAIWGERRAAMIVDPSTPAAGRRAHPMSLGDTYQGYTLTDIAESQIVLEFGSRREVIPLFDSSKHPAQGSKTAILPTRVVTFGGGAGGASGVAQPVVSASSAATSRPAPAAVSPASTVSGASQTAQPASPQRGLIRPAQSQVRQAPAAVSQPSGSDQGGTQIIRTPFGDIVRPRQPNP